MPRTAFAELMPTARGRPLGRLPRAIFFAIRSLSVWVARLSREC